MRNHNFPLNSTEIIESVDKLYLCYLSKLISFCLLLYMFIVLIVILRHVFWVVGF